MAFFGLTHLGPSNHFQRTAASRRSVLDFTDSQFTDAFKVMASSSSMSKQIAVQARLAQQLAQPTQMVLPVDDARLLLLTLFECEPSQREIQLLQRNIRLNAEDSKESITTARVVTFMTQTQFLRAIQATRQELEHSPDTCSPENATSASKLLEARHRHQRSAQGPSDHSRQPLTTSSDYGFYTPSEAENTLQRERRSCEETKYASALVLSGLY